MRRVTCSEMLVVAAIGIVLLSLLLSKPQSSVSESSINREPLYQALRDLSVELSTDPAHSNYFSSLHPNLGEKERDGSAAEVLSRQLLE